MTDTVANIPLRVPIQGVAAESLTGVESEGNSWYNGLGVILGSTIRAEVFSIF